jgi:hypothetical protein
VGSRASSGLDCSKRKHRTRSAKSGIRSSMLSSGMLRARLVPSMYLFSVHQMKNDRDVLTGRLSEFYMCED